MTGRPSGVASSTSRRSAACHSEPEIEPIVTRPSTAPVSALTAMRRATAWPGAVPRMAATTATTTRTRPAAKPPTRISARRTSVRLTHAELELEPAEERGPERRAGVVVLLFRQRAGRRDAAGRLRQVERALLAWVGVVRDVHAQRPQRRDDAQANAGRDLEPRRNQPAGGLVPQLPGIHERREPQPA